jgi:hypothetical protein
VSHCELMPDNPVNVTDSTSLNVDLSFV